MGRSFILIILISMTYLNDQRQAAREAKSKANKYTISGSCESGSPAEPGSKAGDRGALPFLRNSWVT